MTRYGLLISPSANRVYADASVALTVAELQILSSAVLGGRLTGIGPTAIAGVPYVGFEADCLGERDAAFLGTVSAAYALFAVDGHSLRPIPLSRLDVLDDDLVTIPKYPGKTNEQFTKLLLNVTLLSSAFAGELLERRFAVLDPLCGRGTTLNQALVYGFDAAGIDLDRKDVEAYASFLRTWLERKRVKHRAEYGPVRRNRQVVARRLQVTLTPSRSPSRGAGDTLGLTVVNADTVSAPDFFRPGSFDVLATDAPYGVQHGSRSGGRVPARGPLDLLTAAVPGWVTLLRRGGAIGIAWNTRVADRADIAGVLATAGLQVLDDGPYRGFRHRVDQAIVRDLLIARRP